MEKLENHNYHDLSEEYFCGLSSKERKAFMSEIKDLSDKDKLKIYKKMIGAMNYSLDLCSKLIPELQKKIKVKESVIKELRRMENE